MHRWYRFAGLHDTNAGRLSGDALLCGIPQAKRAGFGVADVGPKVQVASDTPASPGMAKDGYLDLVSPDGLIEIDRLKTQHELTTTPSLSLCLFSGGRTLEGKQPEPLVMTSHARTASRARYGSRPLALSRRQPLSCSGKWGFA